MNADGKTKICRDCRVAKLLTDYYRHRNSTQQRCKPCHASKRRQYITNGNYVPKQRQNAFDKLTQETREAIVNDSKTMTIVNVSIKHGINKKTIYSWKYRGLLV